MREREFGPFVIGNRRRLRTAPREARRKLTNIRVTNTKRGCKMLKGIFERKSQTRHSSSLRNTLDETNRRAKIIGEGIKYRASKHYLQGHYENPFVNPDLMENALKQIMAEYFQYEMDKLIKERGMIKASKNIVHGSVVAWKGDKLILASKRSKHLVAVYNMRSKIKGFTITGEKFSFDIPQGFRTFGEAEVNIANKEEGL